MSDAFNAYHKWLGIPPQEQPADHYRLLAIARFENDPDVIEGAADRQMGHVRTFQTGPHSAQSQKLLNELSAARLCLLSPEKKAAYDAELRHRVAAAQAPQPVLPTARPLMAAPVQPLAPMPVVVEPPALIVTESGPVRHTVGRRRRALGSAMAAWLALTAVALSAVIYIGYLIATKPQPGQKAPPTAGSDKPAKALTKTLQPKPLARELKQPSVQPSKPADLSTAGREVPASGSTPEVGRVDADSEGFVSLFNGKDLSGWKPHPRRQGLWRVDEEGVLVGSGPAASYLFSDRGNFTNFHLRAEVRINDGGNSGIYGRSTFGAAPTLDGYEAQINSTGRDSNRTGSLYKAGGAVYTVASSPVRSNEWFTLELIANDNHIVVKVNGQTTADYSDPDRRFTMGHLALQQHDPQTVVEFRKIEIREPDAQADNVSLAAATTASAHDAAMPAETPPQPPSLGAEENTPASLSAKEAFPLAGHTGTVTRLAFHRTMPLLASAGKDGQVLLWNLQTKAKQAELQKFRYEAWAVKFSPDGGVVAFANRYGGGSRLLFKSLAGQQLNEVKDFKNGGAVASIAYSPDGRLFASGQDNGSIRLWDVAQFKEIAPIGLGGGHNVYGLAFGPVSVDRKNRRTEYLLAEGGQDGMVRTLAATLAIGRNGAQWTFQPTSVQFPKSGSVIGVRFNPDGKLLGFTRSGGHVCLCDPQTGANVRDLAAGSRGGGSVEWIAFHPQRPWCVTAHKKDQVARIWNTESGELLCELRGHAGGVMCAEFSPDGRQVATASEDFSIKLWELAGPGGPADTPRGKKPKPIALLVGE
jgi:WD40 repeat protein